MREKSLELKVFMSCGYRIVDYVCSVNGQLAYGIEYSKGDDVV